MADNTTGKEMTVIGADTLIRGEMTFTGSARILGRFEGKIHSQGRVEIGQTAECKANVEAGTIIVDGVIEGDVIAHERLELRGTSQIRGDLTAAKLVASEGASFTGQCSVGPEAVKNVKSMGDAALRSPVRPSVTTTTDGENAIAGLESKLAGFARSKAVAAAE